VTNDRHYLTVDHAAKRVERDKRTIERWIAEGLLDVTVLRNLNGTIVRRYVEREQLLAVYRSKILSNPTRGPE
jgi:predicted site-specific integrase-resolvase